MPGSPVHALMALMLIGVAPCLMAETAGRDLDYMAVLQREARAARRPYPDFARIDPALDDAMLYAVQHRFVAGDLADGQVIGGFKGGFFPSAPLGGVLFRAGFVADGARVDPQEYVSLLIEAEIGFEFCAPVSAPLADVAALQAVVCRLRPVVELPDAAVHDLDLLKQDPLRLRRALIPNNVATRTVLLGAPIKAGTVDPADVDVVARHDGVVIGRRAAAPRPDLWQAVLWVVNDFVLRHGYTLVAGQIIIPGNLTGLHPGQPGHYAFDFGGLGKVEFTVGATAP